MEVLRVPPYPITTKWDVPAANTAYSVYVEDLVDHSYETTTLTSDSDKQISYILPRSKVQYDRDFLFKVTDSSGEIVVDDNLSVYRPYVNPNNLGTTVDEIAEYKKWEIVARSLMDNYLNSTADFYNHKLVIVKEGQGGDYFPIWHNVNKVLKVYENNVLVYNAEDVAITIATQTPTVSSGTVTLTTSSAHGFEIGDVVTISAVVPTGYRGTFVVTAVPTTTSFSFANSTTGNITTAGSVIRIWEYEYKTLLDNSAIARVEANGTYNRYESTPLRLPAASGDLGLYSGGGSYVAFAEGSDFTFILDAGYKTIPPDIERAATILVEELKCGTNDYYKRFVSEYSTDQFDIKFAPQFLEGTGNMLVDKILNNYKGSQFKPAIL
jgi:hypothetical protein